MVQKLVYNNLVFSLLLDFVGNYNMCTLEVVLIVMAFVVGYVLIAGSATFFTLAYIYCPLPGCKNARESEAVNHNDSGSYRTAPHGGVLRGSSGSGRRPVVL